MSCDSLPDRAAEDLCGNEDCDVCYPMPRWDIQRVTVRRIAHKREIKAPTAEAAFAIYDQGTAWPSEYDERTLEVLERHEPTAERVIDERKLAFYRAHNCWHRLNRRADAPVTATSEGEDL